MNKRLITTSVALLFGLGLMAQDKNAIQYSKPVNKENAYKHLSILASDEYEGRETGTRGAWMAADYIKKHFKSLGLVGPVKNSADPYLQPVNVVSTQLSDVSLSINGKNKENYKEFYIMPRGLSSGFNVNGNAIVFAGYGINKEGYNEYEGLDVKGKIVLIFATGDPTAKAPEAGQARRMPTGMASQQAKIKHLTEQNAAGVLVINERVDNMQPQMLSFLKEPSIGLKSATPASAASLPVVTVGTAVANDILAAANTDLASVKAKIKETQKPASLVVNVPVSFKAKLTEERVKADNVLGFLEGSDPKLKHEIIAVTAHYDHIGIEKDPNAVDKINNGADDDGSGTTGVLMLAEAFAKAKKAGHGPKRSILFMTFVGEEKGLWGSEWYSEHPVFPFANTIADLNIDMIGRGDDDRPGDNNFVYIIGSNMLSDDLDAVGKKANKDYVNITLDEKYNNRTDPNRFYYRSDHYNFAKHGIPVIFYFNGVHKDYHKPGDEVSKIDFPMLTKRAQLVYYTAWELANGKNRPVVNKNEDGTLKK
jgi:Zn-dependent M28 family amino/carboxypeptidase